MSVRCKALSFALLGSIVVSSGCAFTNPPSDSEGSAENTVQPSEAYGDVATENIGDAPDGSPAASLEIAPVAQAAQAEEILAKNSSGVGITAERTAASSKYMISVPGGEPVVDVLALENPSRIVVDLLGQNAGVNKEIPLSNDATVSSVRLGSHKDRTRLVFDVKPGQEQLEHLVTTQDGVLTVTFVPKGGSAIEVAAAPAIVVPDTTTPEAIAPSLPLEENTQLAASEIEVIDATPSAPIEKAVENSPVADVSDEDIAAATPEEATKELAQSSSAGDATLEELAFEKTHGNSGQVSIQLTDEVAFELRKSAPSEYTLTLPGVKASEQAKLPQIAPKSFPGIRSVRATETPEGTTVRMFIDSGIKLDAVPQGNKVLISAVSQPIGEEPLARAQLAPESGAAAPLADDQTARENPTGIRSADGSKIYTGRLISLDLQDTDIDNALRIIAEVSNLNIIASDDVSGKVTLRLIDVPWDQALDVILKTNGLDQVTEGNVIRIAPVDKLRQEREALREAKRAAENLEDLTVQYIRVSYARADELKPQVESVLSERGTVAADERTNQLIIKDIQTGQKQALELLKKLDLRTPQVLLETQIVEGQRNVLRDLGFQWNFTYVQSPETGNATGLNFPNSVTVGGSADGTNSTLANFPAVLTDAAGSAISAVFDSADGSRSIAARLSALETEGKVKVVSRPQVATVNNKQAQIRSVETVRVRLPDSGTSIATGSGASASGGGSTAFEEIDVGIELQVTPQASPDYYVLLDINARSSSFGSTVVDNIPSTLEREATSTILVKSGQTFALGGVYRIEDTDQLQGVPFLKDIPFLGALFRRSFIDKSDEELIFFITPHIVEGSFDPSLM